jgi:hypothetical protein
MPSNLQVEPASAQWSGTGGVFAIMKKSGCVIGAISVVLAAGLWPPVVLGETVYRCPPGNVYQQEPCDRGLKLDIDPKMNMIGTAPSPSSLYLSDIASSDPGGPWVATIPMPPRMTSTPSRHTTFRPPGHVIRFPKVHDGHGRPHYYGNHRRK